MVDAYCEVMGWDDTDTVTDRPNALIGVNRAYRRFLGGQHPDTPGVPHPWSFLRPMGSIQIPVSITGTGTGTFATGSTTIVDDDSGDLFTNGTHPSGEIGLGILVDGVGLLRVTTVSDTNTIIATGGVANFTSKTFYTGMQVDMPADFAGLVTPFFYPYDSAEGTGPRFTEMSPERMLLELQESPSSGTPYQYALVPLPIFTATVGQRYAAIFWPVADADRVIQFRYRSVPADVTDSTTCFFVGGVDHSDTIELAVRAKAEFASRKKEGTYEAAFLTAMMGSIGRDATMFYTEAMPHIVEG